MCNRSLQEGILPPSQKHAVITPIIKKAGSDPLDVRSYRPVSNLSSLSKLVEMMVSRRMTRFLEEEKLLTKFQSRVSCSPLHRNRHLKGSGWFIDSDRPAGGRSRSSVCSICRPLSHWLTDQQVAFGGISSATLFVKFGVPQGSVLWPLLFVLYTEEHTTHCRGFQPEHPLLWGWWTTLSLRSGSGTTRRDIQSRVVHSRVRVLDELKPSQAQFGKDTVHLFWN